MKKLISFVVPVYNEEQAVGNFYQSMLLPELEKLKDFDYELIFVEDGSRDHTRDIINSLADRNKKIKTIILSRNFGKEVALTAGIREAKGDAIITMDSDGQQPPALIHKFIKAWQEGADIVTGVRGKFEKHGFIAKLGSKWFYRILTVLGANRTVPGSTDYRLIDRSVADEFNKLTEHGRITRGLIDWMGYSQAHIEYVYGNRIGGKPSYNFKKLFNLALDSFVSLTTTPLMLFGYLGVFITLASGALGLFVIIQQHILQDPLHFNWTGPTQLSIFITFLIGLVLISQSITALYVAHIHNETKNRPLYLIDRKASKNLS